MKTLALERVTCRRIVVSLLVGAAAWSPLGVTAAPLRFTDALRLAEERAPSLAAQSARVDAARSSAVPAGELPDPKLFFGVENFPVSGPDAGQLERDFMTMERVGVMQEVPNGAKRQARTNLARAQVSRIEAERQVERLAVLRDTASAWLARYYAERRVSLFDELDRENALFADTVAAQVSAGKGMTADLLMPRQEALMLADRRDDLRRDLRQARERLRRRVGADADESLAGQPPAVPADLAAFRHRLHRHPEFAAFDSMTRMAQAELSEAEAMKSPDWAFEFAYQRRAPRFGDMISAQITVDLPVFASRRQDPQIAAKRLELVRVEAERDATLREHAAMLENDLADYERLELALQRSVQSALPLAREKIELLLAGYRTGKAELSALLGARREWIEARLRNIDLEAQRAEAAVRLMYAYPEDAQ
jgi:cobalt-zinc-cadmium efflux system outer membrane protein